MQNITLRTPCWILLALALFCFVEDEIALASQCVGSWHALLYEKRGRQMTTPHDMEIENMFAHRAEDMFIVHSRQT